MLVQMLSRYEVISEACASHSVLISSRQELEVGFLQQIQSRSDANVKLYHSDLVAEYPAVLKQVVWQPENLKKTFIVDMPQCDAHRHDRQT